MNLIVGLGNPGKRYDGTRHNVGFMVVDRLAAHLGIASFQKRFGAEVASASLDGKSSLLVKPMEFMNKSGYATARAWSFCKPSAEEVVIIHDEIDLPHGTLRLKKGGGHGGHNGLRSIMDQTGVRDFLRVRVGVGKPGNQGASEEASDHETHQSVASYVLQGFSKHQMQSLSELIERASESVRCIYAQGIDYAMNHFN